MKDLFTLVGKRAVVIGGGGGIGRSLAAGLAHYGAEVIVAGRDVEKLSAVARDVYKQTGRDIKTRVVDVCDEESVKRLALFAETEGGTDILVNSQGVNIKKSAFEMTTKDWDDTFAVNIRGVMLSSVAFARYMCERKRGRIISISSIRGDRAAAGNGMALAYSASKGAVNMFTKQMAAEVACCGVTVNAICPAATKTEAAADTEKLLPGIEKYLTERIPLGRMATPEDMIGVVVLLASDAGAFITGSCIYVDGGMSAVC